jgi:hypothetical protein
MLTILNVNKLNQYAFDKHWLADSISETENWYHFVLVRKNPLTGKIDDVRKLSLNRVAKSGGEYSFRLDNKRIGYVVTLDYIKDINNLVNKFTEIMGGLQR